MPKYVCAPEKPLSKKGISVCVRPDAGARSKRCDGPSENAMYAAEQHVVIAKLAENAIKTETAEELLFLNDMTPAEIKFLAEKKALDAKAELEYWDAVANGYNAPNSTDDDDSDDEDRQFVSQPSSSDEFAYEMQSTLAAFRRGHKDVDFIPGMRIYTPA